MNNRDQAKLALAAVTIVATIGGPTLTYIRKVRKVLLIQKKIEARKAENQACIKNAHVHLMRVAESKDFDRNEVMDEMHYEAAFLKIVRNYR